MDATELKVFEAELLAQLDGIDELLEGYQSMALAAVATDEVNRRGRETKSDL